MWRTWRLCLWNLSMFTRIYWTSMRMSYLTRNLHSSQWKGVRRAWRMYMWKVSLFYRRRWIALLRTILRHLSRLFNISEFLFNYYQTCPSKCVEYKPCVMCQQWHTGPYNETKCEECPFVVIPVEELPKLNVSDSDSWNECQFVDPTDDCTFYFLYYYDGVDNLVIELNF